MGLLLLQQVKEGLLQRLRAGGERYQVQPLGVEGLASALILLAWTLVYQQFENYFLSPRLSSRTMELNGGVAFGAALAGGAIAGPMGAFMALPVAALITATIPNASRTYDVVYEGKSDSKGKVDESFVVIEPYEKLLVFGPRNPRPNDAVDPNTPLP